MAKYRKKPVVIEAFQFQDQSNLNPEVPLWFVDAINAGKIIAAPTYIMIGTLEGQMRASVGDWIIQGVKGEIYPCKPDIFAATYDAAADPQ